MEEAFPLIAASLCNMESSGSGSGSGSESDLSLIDEIDLGALTPSKISYVLKINDPDKTIKTIRLEGDSIATSVYDPENSTVTLYGLVQDSVYAGLDLVIVLKDGKELEAQLPSFKTPKVSSAAEWVQGFYNIFFGRDGDEAGMKYWSSELLSQRLSAGYFITNIVNEKEYIEKNYDDSVYIARMYRAVVGRDPDAEGFAWWLETLNSYIKQFGNRTVAMQQIALRMLGETETKAYIRSLGMKVDD